MSPPNADPETRSRRLLPLASLVLSPLAFLALLELLLWLVGFGGPLPLFVEVPGRPGWLHANPEVMRRYFPSRAPRVSPEAIEFPAEKPEGAFRIVVQGGSTAAGFPYGRFAGLAGMLGERLEATFPERDIEVISTAMAAVNSYTLLDFVDEILAIRPDAVLIYAGHNEYMGVLGVSSGLTSRRSRPATLLHLRLRRFRAYQYLEALVAAGRSLLLGAAPDPDATADGHHLMSRAARGSRIPYRSDAWLAGVAQFEANLDAILSRYREAGVPVFVATLVSNEKDRPPFASADGPDGAAAWFERGRRALERGDAEAARRAFREARDRDELPFRAPQAFDDVVRKLAERHGATLVDASARFAAASPQGIVGHELLLEHVHPNAEGYFLLADAFFDALRDELPLGDWSRAPSDAESHRDMPITPLDRALAALSVRVLKADFPFVPEAAPVSLPQPANAIEALALRRHREEISWLESMEQLMQRDRRAGRTRDAAVVARMAAQVFPGERATNFTTGSLYLELGELARARRYLERSLRLAPQDPATRRAMAQLERLEAARADGRASPVAGATRPPPRRAAP
jgi:lysophospholipase L1-like esterase